jgi:WD40 repeat protein
MRILLLLCLSPIACAGEAFSADWSPDGKWIAVGTGHSVRIEDAKTRKLVRTIDSWSTVHAVRFGTRSEDLLFAGKGNTFTIAGIDGKVRVSHDGINPVVGFSAARSDDGKTIVSVDTDHDLLVWSHPFRAPKRKLTGAGHVWKYALTPDGIRAFAVNRKGELTSWDVGSGKRRGTFSAHKGYVFAMRMSRDGRFLATGGSADDKTVALWDPVLFQLKRRIEAKVIVRALAFSPDGKRLAVGGNKKRVDVYGTRTGKRLETIRGLPGTPSALAFAPDGKRLLIVTFRGRTEIRDLAIR